MNNFWQRTINNSRKLIFNRKSSKTGFLWVQYLSIFHPSPLLPGSVGAAGWSGAGQVAAPLQILNVCSSTILLKFLFLFFSTDYLLDLIILSGISIILIEWMACPILQQPRFSWECNILISSFILTSHLNWRKITQILFGIVSVKT